MVIEIEASDANRCTALYALADDCGRIDGMQELAKVLVNLGANVNQQNVEGDSPIHVAVRNHYSPEMIECLLSLGTDPNMLCIDDYEPSSAFFLACKATLKVVSEEYMPRDYAHIVNLFLEAEKY